ncbi:hypothetical protein F7725_018063 [Dissostichus mawsoni]|uniref:Metalloendopeptidase n=1 Tax=Dissostichus mawsoni TaxID=36200 RepID=A0A7J5XQE6_DISMA|nr:hypothetical protein F7725_018063 [Dissostichus mawsoni]
MHYGKDAFSNGNGLTILTKDPKFQDVIGQRMEVSPIDALELNLLYKCKSTIAFQMQCSFPDETMCQMTSCLQSGLGWEMVTNVTGGPMSDHTNLPSGSGEQGLFQDTRMKGYIFLVVTLIFLLSFSRNTMNAKGLTLKAFDQFRLKSCIDFKPRDSEEYYIHMFSYIGKVHSNGQNLSIGSNCDSISTVEHEFLHALGFYHEQSRYDRDDYVTIVNENIQEGLLKTLIKHASSLYVQDYIKAVSNFDKQSNETITDQGVPYDYWSVMHYGRAFSNGNVSTLTKDPKFQDVIGQRLEVSPKRSGAEPPLQMHFPDETMCQMTSCSQSGFGWEMVTNVTGGPMSDHTNLTSGSGEQGEDAGYFMHVSTASGEEGDSAWLETHRMSLNREHHVQCLQFYYYHSGNMSDHLNIWIREFQDELDLKGTLRLMGQIDDIAKFFLQVPTNYWKLHHVSLNATKHFQVEFEVRKGAGSSTGGFSIDDINLSEIECPHVTMQLDEFERNWDASDYGASKYSTRYYSSGGYAYALSIELYDTHFGLFVQLVSGENDDRLEWPCTERQVTFKMLDQNANIQLQMSKQFSITSDLSTSSDGSYVWDNPRLVGLPYVDDNDITALINGSALPIPQVGQVNIKYPPKELKEGPCSSRMSGFLLLYTQIKNG